jgi:hypothetical protein
MAKKGQRVERVTVSWGQVERTVKVGRTKTRKKFLAVSRITKEAANALGLVEFKSGGRGAASAYKKTKSGANVLNRSAGGTTRGKKAYVSIGERTPKGSLKFYSVPVPAGVTLTMIHKVAKNIKFLKWQGGKADNTPEKGATKKALPPARS